MENEARTTHPVLLIEDDPDIRAMVGQLLELEGYRVLATANGNDALEMLRQGERPCLILLDLMMPVMNGWQFRQAQASDPRLSGIPVVVVTAAGAREDIPAIEADGWISKPVDFDRLLEAIVPLCNRV